MIIERSAFAGIGKYGSRWMGDNWSAQDFMGFSLVGL
jgi:alpha-glucosidase (family GH31 glycosyl hydrolase)